MAPWSRNFTPPSPAARDIPKYAALWCAIALVIGLVVTALHLPERMDCQGRGRLSHCQHSLLSPQTWRRP
jgi:hypothetical protein